MTRDKAGRHQTARFMAQSRAISDHKFGGREISSKIFGPDRAGIACNRARRGIMTLGRVFGDLIDSRQGRASSGSAIFGAISSDLGPKIWRPRNFFENFRSKPRRYCMQSRTPRHNDAGQSLWGPHLCLINKYEWSPYCILFVLV